MFESQLPCGLSMPSEDLADAILPHLETCPTCRQRADVIVDARCSERTQAPEPRDFHPGSALDETAEISEKIAQALADGFGVPFRICFEPMEDDQ